MDIAWTLRRAALHCQIPFDHRRTAVRAIDAL